MAAMAEAEERRSRFERVGGEATVGLAKPNGTSGLRPSSGLASLRDGVGDARTVERGLAREVRLACDLRNDGEGVAEAILARTGDGGGGSVLERKGTDPSSRDTDAKVLGSSGESRTTAPLCAPRSTAPPTSAPRRSDTDGCFLRSFFISRTGARSSAGGAKTSWRRDFDASALAARLTLGPLDA